MVSNTGQSFEGSDFVYADGLVMANAHVVAGVDRPWVQTGGVGQRLPAAVVLHGQGTDAAVLHVPGLNTPGVSFADRRRHSHAVRPLPDAGVSA
ncbi:trypsin-like peptidase domain-containing protein [Streptomyces sp. NPDC048324]|uniref:trypsin-like peptidase domain-containing protein n=1 Tax=Streptomyces sp. NPDC048324 TaxID=3157205 RepID=UPI0034355B2E